MAGFGVVQEARGWGEGISICAATKFDRTHIETNLLGYNGGLVTCGRVKGPEREVNGRIDRPWVESTMECT